MARLRNITPHDLAVYYPPGHANAVNVPAGEVLEIAGDVTESDDAYTAGEGDSARAYPKAVWALERDARTVTGGSEPQKKNTKAEA